MPLESEVMAQNDVGEFQSLLMDRLGELFPTPLPENAGLHAGHANVNPDPHQRYSRLSFAPGDDVFTRLCGGKSAQQILGRGACPHARETAQPFLCITLDVAGLAAPTIEASLAAFTHVRRVSNLCCLTHGGRAQSGG